MNRRQALLGAVALAACNPPAARALAPRFPMRRSVNLGNALEAPNEGDWGYRIAPSHLSAIAAAGFDGVRLPVRWDAHMDGAGAVDGDFFDRVEAVVAQALDNRLFVQLDVHHYDALISNTEAETPRFLALWRQIGERFAQTPDKLIFEALNEPNGGLDGQRLSDLQERTLAVIRLSNPARLVVLGPGNWNSIDALANWRPPRDAHIAASVHYYEPHNFTHQNAEWLGANAPNFGRAWGTPADFAALGRDIERAADWSRTHGLALQVGEFGVNRAVGLPQRVRWTRAAREAIEARDLGWCVWDFAGAFPIFDLRTQRFIPEMLAALQAPRAEIRSPA